MITLPAAVRVYLHKARCDMRRGFDALKALAEHGVGVDPLAGHLFVFCSRRTGRVKILYWDRDGWALWAKRLEAGAFAFPFASTGRNEVTAAGLSAAGGVGLGKCKTAKTVCRAESRRDWKALRSRINIEF
jgi:transposase